MDYTGWAASAFPSSLKDSNTVEHHVPAILEEARAGRRIELMATFWSGAD
jgi:hypothetical protein